MIEAWIDTLTAVWAISDGSLSISMLSYNFITSTDFPESIDPSDLMRQPIAMTFPPSLDPIYSLGGPRIALWEGFTAFHLAPDLSTASLGKLLHWYKDLWNAAAAKPTLSGKVELFWIPDEPLAFSELMAIHYGNETPHWGLTVKWKVKEHVESEISVGGP